MSWKLIPFGRASLMLDAVTIAMLLVLPLLTWSIHYVRSRRGYGTHRRVQLWTGLVLLAAIVAFEIEIRLHGWRHLALPSPYYDSWLFPVLYVHLVFAIATTALWAYAIISALKRMRAPSPAGASRHRVIGRIAAGLMYSTALSGWTFYWMAFVA